MKQLNSLLRWSATAAALCVALSPLGALADTTTNIPLSYGAGPSSYLYPNWSAALEGDQIAAAPTTGNTGTGVTFSAYSGQFVEVNPGNSYTVTGLSILLTSDSVLQTLLNTFYGNGVINGVITVTSSNGGSASYNLVGDQTDRDYYDNTGANYANGLSGCNFTLGTTTCSGDGVTATTWWTNAAGVGSGNYEGLEGPVRLDMQSIVLPSSWAGTDLSSITLTGISTPGTQDAELVLSAAQVDAITPVVVAATPEPSSLVLLGTGVLGIAGAMRRRFAPKA